MATEREIKEAANAILLLVSEIERLRTAMEGLVHVVKAAGLDNLVNGVQLGQTSWFVKASDALEQAEAALGEG